MRRYDRFEGKRRLATKINIIFFVGINVLNIFHSITFSKKTIFSKITAKNYFWGHDYFWGNGAPTTKINITFFLEGGKRVPNTVLKFCFFFFFKKPHTIWLETRKTGFWANFPHICGSIGPIVSKNNRVHSWVNSHQPCKLHENWFETSTCIVTFYTYIWCGMRDFTFFHFLGSSRKLRSS